jgi:hypothetical protein
MPLSESVAYTFCDLLAHQLLWVQYRAGNTVKRTSSDVTVDMRDLPLKCKIVVASLVNQQLKTYPSYTQSLLNEKHNFVTHVIPSNLISAIWLQFHQYITGMPDMDAPRIVRCMTCGIRDWFDINHVENKDMWMVGRKEDLKGKFRHRSCVNRKKQFDYRNRVKKSKKDT